MVHRQEVRLARKAFVKGRPCARVIFARSSGCRCRIRCGWLWGILHIFSLPIPGISGGIGGVLGANVGSVLHPSRKHAANIRRNLRLRWECKSVTEATWNLLRGCWRSRSCLCRRCLGLRGCNRFHIGNYCSIRVASPPQTPIEGTFPFQTILADASLSSGLTPHQECSCIVFVSFNGCSVWPCPRFFDCKMVIWVTKESSPELLYTR